MDRTLTRSLTAEPRSFHFFGTIVTIHVSGEQTGGAFALVESVSAPGRATPVHLHQREEETFHVREGELTVMVEDEAVVLQAGQSFVAPRGIRHQLVNRGTVDCRHLTIASPAGFDAFIETVGVPVVAGGEPPASPTPAQRQKAVEIAATFGIDIFA